MIWNWGRSIPELPNIGEENRMAKISWKSFDYGHLSEILIRREIPLRCYLIKSATYWHWILHFTLFYSNLVPHVKHDTCFLRFTSFAIQFWRKQSFQPFSTPRSFIKAHWTFRLTDLHKCIILSPMFIFP